MLTIAFAHRNKERMKCRFEIVTLISWTYNSTNKKSFKRIMIEEKRKKLGEETVSSRINKRKNWTKSKSRGKKIYKNMNRKIVRIRNENKHA